jgi:hypothetical protein
MKIKKAWKKTPGNVKKLTLTLSILFLIVICGSFIFTILIPKDIPVDELNDQLHELSIEELNQVIKENEESFSFVGKSTFIDRVRSVENRIVPRRQLIQQTKIVRSSKIILSKFPKCLPNVKHKNNNYLIKVCSFKKTKKDCRKNAFLMEGQINLFRRNFVNLHDSCLPVKDVLSCMMDIFNNPNKYGLESTCHWSED